MNGSFFEPSSRVWVWKLALCLALAGCRKPADKPEPAAAPPKHTVLIGSVRIEAGHEDELPTYTDQDMERAVLAHVHNGTAFPDVCTPAKKEDRVPVKLTPDGKLVGVMLAASEFTGNPAQSPRAHVVAIQDCRLNPRMVVARVGDMLHIQNETEFAMMPGMGSETFSQTMTKGQSRDIVLDTGGVKILACGFSGPCGRTDVVVLAHPYGAVTDAKGEFRIDDFPAGETVRINAWHPLFFEAFQSVRVELGQEKRVELVLTPRPPPKPEVPFKRDPNQVYPD